MHIIDLSINSETIPVPEPVSSIISDESISNDSERLLMVYELEIFSYVFAIESNFFLNSKLDSFSL